jgi:cysteine desulfurase
MARHYLDHASTSPLRPVAVAALFDAAERSGAGTLADPGRVHTEGMTARVLLENARDDVASLIGAKSREIVFTSSATESIAAATWGAVRRAGEDGRRPHIVHTAVEHSAVRRSSAMFTAALGGSVTEIGVDATGRVDADAFVDALTPDTALAHLQWGNHEVGTVQPIREVVAACRERGILVHVDAAQAVGRIRVDPRELGIDLLSFSGHKFGAPTGTGVLWVRQGLRLEPLLVGGEQERGRRAGLENLAALLSLGAVAASLDPATLDAEMTRSREFCATVIERLTAIEGISLLGDPAAEGRLPHLVCLAVGGVEPQGVVLGLDQRGFAVHSGSSCASEGLEPSPVLEAMGADAERSLRISVGWNTSASDIDELCTELPVVVDHLRSLAG